MPVRPILKRTRAVPYSGGRVSTLFIVVVTAIFCIFGFFMLDANRYRLHTDSIEQAERAQVEGPAPTPAGETMGRLREAAYSHMIEAIKAADDSAFDSALKELMEQPAYGDHLPRAAVFAILKDNEHAARELLAIDRTCDYRITRSICGAKPAALGPTFIWPCCLKPTAVLRRPRTRTLCLTTSSIPVTHSSR